MASQQSNFFFVRNMQWFRDLCHTSQERAHGCCWNNTQATITT